MARTRYAGLTNEELLAEADRRRSSPIIDELYQRLDAKGLALMGSDCRVECPVCEAGLTAGYDDANDLFTLEMV